MPDASTSVDRPPTSFKMDRADKAHQQACREMLENKLHRRVVSELMGFASASAEAMSGCRLWPCWTRRAPSGLSCRSLGSRVVSSVDGDRNGR